MSSDFHVSSNVAVEFGVDDGRLVDVCFVVIPRCPVCVFACGARDCAIVAARCFLIRWSLGSAVRRRIVIALCWRPCFSGCGCGCSVRAFDGRLVRLGRVTRPVSNGCCGDAWSGDGASSSGCSSVRCGGCVVPTVVVPVRGMSASMTSVCCRRIHCSSCAGLRGFPRLVTIRSTTPTAVRSALFSKRTVSSVPA